MFASNKRSIRTVCLFLLSFFISCSSSTSVEDSSFAIKTYTQQDAVNCAFLDHQGAVWFGTNHEGIYRFDGEKFQQFTEKDGLCNNYVTSITEDQERNLWFGTLDGLCQFDHHSFMSLSIPWDGNEALWGEGMNAKKVLAVATDRANYLWFGTWGGGAYRYDGSEFTSYLAKEGRLQDNGKHQNVIQSILIDSHGDQWFTSMTHGGISQFDGDSMSHFTTENGLLDDMFTCSFEDSKGNIWFGSLGNREEGLLKYNGTTFQHFNAMSGLPNNNIRGICEDNSGRLWLASSRGSLCLFDGTSFSVFTSKQGQTFEGMLFVTKDADGNMWFGGTYGRLYRFEGEEVVDFTTKRHK